MRLLIQSVKTFVQRPPLCEVPTVAFYKAAVVRSYATPSLFSWRGDLFHLRVLAIIKKPNPINTSTSIIRNIVSITSVLDTGFSPRHAL